MREPNVQLSQSRHYTASFWYKNKEDDGHRVPCHLDALSRRQSSINQTVVRMHLKVCVTCGGKSSFKECLTLIFSTLAEVCVKKASFPTTYMQILASPHCMTRMSSRRNAVTNTESYSQQANLHKRHKIWDSFKLWPLNYTDYDICLAEQYLFDLTF